MFDKNEGRNDHHDAVDVKTTKTDVKVVVNKKEAAKVVALVGAGIAAGAIVTSAYLGQVHAAELALANQSLWGRFTSALSRIF